MDSLIIVVESILGIIGVVFLLIFSLVCVIAGWHERDEQKATIGLIGLGLIFMGFIFLKYL